MKVLKYKSKIIGIGLTLIAITSVVLAIVMSAVVRFNESNTFSAFAENFSKNVYICDVKTKRFFLEIYIDHKKQYNSSSKDEIRSVFENLKTTLKNTQLDQSFFAEKEKLTLSITEIETALNKIENSYTERGFKDSGYEGKMRTAIHELEHQLEAKNMILLLTLRRHEKDFFLRKDMSYVKKFDETLAKLASQLSGKSHLLPNLNEYDLYFKKIIEIEKNVGLSQNEGFQHVLYTHYEQMEQICDVILQRANIKKELAWDYLILGSILLISVIIGLIVLSIFAIRFFNRQIVNPSVKLTAITHSLAEGNLNINTDEIENMSFLGEITMSFKDLVQNYKSSFNKIEDLIEGIEIEKLEIKSDDDVISMKLNQLNQTLTEQRLAQTNRFWFDSGIKQLTEILYQTEQKEEVPQIITQFLVNYLKANQAAVFIKDFKAVEIEFVQLGTYAYARKKHENARIKIYEGLVGQCAAEKQTIFMTDVPQDYVKITSGLGEARPTCVAIIPFVQNQEVIAILEICSFSIISAFELEFLESCGKNVATALNQNYMALKSQKMLADTQKNMQQLAESEEEMRQNLEEMQAIQEEFARKETKYLAELASIKEEFALRESEYFDQVEEWRTKNENQAHLLLHHHDLHEKEKKVYVAKIQEMQRIIYKNHLSILLNENENKEEKNHIRTIL